MPRLTPRQHEVLTLLLNGLTYQEIAERLGVSHSTVKSHLRHIAAHGGYPARVYGVRLLRARIARLEREKLELERELTGLRLRLRERTSQALWLWRVLRMRDKDPHVT